MSLKIQLIEWKCFSVSHQYHDYEQSSVTKSDKLSQCWKETNWVNVEIWFSLWPQDLPWCNKTEDFKNKRRKKANSHSSAFHWPGSNALSRPCINRPPKMMMTMSKIMRMIIVRMMIMMRMIMRARVILNIVTQKGRNNSILYLANVLIISELRFHLFTFISHLPATALQCNILREILQKRWRKQRPSLINM